MALRGETYFVFGSLTISAPHQRLLLQPCTAIRSCFPPCTLFSFVFFGSEEPRFPAAREVQLFVSLHQPPPWMWITNLEALAEPGAAARM